MIREAYDVRDFQITAGPAWLDTDRFDIRAKAKEGVSTRQMKTLLQALLADRFQLRLHRETKELPVYTLSVAKNGAKFREATADDQHTTAAGPGEITDHGVAIPIFIKQLSGLVDRAVVDQTGLKGSYDLNLQWTREQDTGPSLFTALEEQLGLKLSGGKGPVEILVIDHVVRVPIEN